jgi:hypothetical protein
MRWTKPALSARVESLAARHRGRELVDAVVAFADTLDEADRRALQDVLLERAHAEGAFDRALGERLDGRRPRLLGRRRPRRGRPD